MITYYLHHTYGQRPFEMLSEYPLDVRPGAWICCHDFVCVVQSECPIVQNLNMGHRVHVEVELLKDEDGKYVPVQLFMKELHEGTIFHRPESE